MKTITLVPLLALLLVPRWTTVSTPTLVPSPVLTFHESFWLNLHQFLYVLGRAQNDAPDRTRDAVKEAPLELEALAARPAAEQAAWSEAVRVYADGLSKRDEIFDPNLVAITAALGRLDDEAPPSAAQVEPALAAALQRAAPIYRAVWWPKHHQANRDRLADLTPLVDRYGVALVTRLTAVYHAEWPAAPRTVNLSAYANWAGAYSTDNGLIVFSSTDPAIAGVLGLETLLHESSHQWDDQIQPRIDAVGRRVGKAVPPDLSHMLIFYTSGEIVRETFPDYVPYAVRFGLWDRGGFRGMKAVLDRDWLPYLRGQGTFDAAIAKILTDHP